MKKILIVETNTSIYATTNRATGLWLGEATHFYDVVTNAGYEVDFMSPLGGYVPIDPHSFKYANEIDWKWYRNPEFVKCALSNTKKPSEINSDDYIAIYYTGGHGVIWDLRNNSELNTIALNIYNNNGFITSVCHGAVGLIDLKTKDGQYLIKNKNITGFSDTEELINRTTKYVPYSTERALKDSGANYIAKRFFSEHVIVDGRIITGQNPQSPKLVAEKLVNALKNN